MRSEEQGREAFEATFPDHIWLDVGEDAKLDLKSGDTFRDLHEVTWSEDNATGYGVKYVRAPDAGEAEAVALTDAAILHRWDTHVGTPDEKRPLTDDDKIGFARACIALALSPTPSDNRQQYAKEGESVCGTCEGRGYIVLPSGRDEDQQEPCPACNVAAPSHPPATVDHDHEWRAHPVTKAMICRYCGIDRTPAVAVQAEPEEFEHLSHRCNVMIEALEAQIAGTATPVEEAHQLVEWLASENGRAMLGTPAGREAITQRIEGAQSCTKQSAEPSAQNEAPPSQGTSSVQCASLATSGEPAGSMLSTATLTPADIYAVCESIEDEAGDSDFQRGARFAAKRIRNAANSLAAHPKPAASEAWENFPCYLIDHCEGETITEEALQRWLAAMLKDPQYTARRDAK